MNILIDYKNLQIVKLLRRKYNNLTLVLFGDLNMSREEVKDKLSIEKESLGFKV